MDMMDGNVPATPKYSADKTSSSSSSELSESSPQLNHIAMGDPPKDFSPTLASGASVSHSSSSSSAGTTTTAATLNKVEQGTGEGAGNGLDTDMAMPHSFSMNPEDYKIGIAIVYHTTYVPLDMTVAVKMIELDHFERNQIDELRREIQVMTLCKHPNLLNILASFVHESKLWIVTPFLSGGSCLDIMKTAFKDGFEEATIATILGQALQGLEYLHRNGHIHRDVKAGNLLMDQDGTVQLADFGVSSSLLDEIERKGIRKTFVGTPCWMAPEVMEITKGYDNKADIWSFGITALELAYGHAPFAKYPPMKVIYLTLSNSPPTLDRTRAHHKYSRTFKDMIDSCLQKDPTRRPTAEALLRHPFFLKMAKKRSYLMTSVLGSVPPLELRPRVAKLMKQVAAAAANNNALDDAFHQPTWDFSSSSDDDDDESLSLASDNGGDLDEDVDLDEDEDGTIEGGSRSASPSALALTLAATKLENGAADKRCGRFVVESETSNPSPRFEDSPTSSCSNALEETNELSGDSVVKVTTDVLRPDPAMEPDPVMVVKEEEGIKKGRFSVLERHKDSEEETTAPTPTISTIPSMPTMSTSVAMEIPEPEISIVPGAIDEEGRQSRFKVDQAASPIHRLNPSPESPSRPTTSRFQVTNNTLSRISESDLENGTPTEAVPADRAPLTLPIHVHSQSQGQSQSYSNSYGHPLQNVIDPYVYSSQSQSQSQWKLPPSHYNFGSSNGFFDHSTDPTGVANDATGTGALHGGPDHPPSHSHSNSLTGGFSNFASNPIFIHPAQIDQLLLLNELIRQQLLELRYARLMSPSNASSCCPSHPMASCQTTMPMSVPLSTHQTSPPMAGVNPFLFANYERGPMVEDPQVSYARPYSYYAAATHQQPQQHQSHQSQQSQQSQPLHQMPPPSYYHHHVPSDRPLNFSNWHPASPGCASEIPPRAGAFISPPLPPPSNSTAASDMSTQTAPPIFVPSQYGRRRSRSRSNSLDGEGDEKAINADHLGIWGLVEDGRSMGIDKYAPNGHPSSQVPFHYQQPQVVPLAPQGNSLRAATMDRIQRRERGTASAPWLGHHHSTSDATSATTRALPPTHHHSHRVTRAVQSMKTSPIMAPPSNIDLESLRREVDSLRRENESLKRTA